MKNGSIKLRKRAMSSGRVSLYLDCYQQGKRVYEYLGLYLLPGDTADARRKNKETMAIAKAIEAKRIVELRNNTFGFANENDSGESVNVAMYFSAYIDTLKGRLGESTIRSYQSACSAFRSFFGDEMTFGRLDADRIAAWANELKKTHKQNTAGTYIKNLFAFLRVCVENGIITKMPVDGRCRIRQEATTRQYLTMEELQQMIDTPCNNKSLKNAFIFSCLTGLRVSDVTNLKWRDVSANGNFVRITFIQKKTRNIEYLDITTQALDYMGERKADDDKVFNLRYSPYMTKYLRQWATAAGVGKPITFHSARHTFATMMIELNTDIYTVSKLLGHRNLATTQVYAKIVDKTKQAAVSHIPIFHKTNKI